MIRRTTWIVALVLLGPLTVQGAEPKIDFNRDVRAILSNNCFACHGPDENTRKAKLRLDTREGATADGAVVPNKPDESEVMFRLRSDDPNEVMPPPKHGKPLSKQDQATIEAWIRQGAPYAKHWSYEVPVAVEPPQVPATFTVRNPIDSFIIAKLLTHGLTPSPEADRVSLARRTALDLTGLPPTPTEAQAFLADPSPGAYERYVDHLLAKPAFGEHWARKWLDLARYADSAGYADDPSRTIWAYRDYVIRSYNANKPFDRFTIEQLAGDLLPNATEEQKIATAFHRNTMTNSEGGTNDEEFRNAAIVDRVNTTMAVWMGTSMGCAQCHTHKYDPITQKEYFEFFAFFNNTADADRRDESPILQVGDTPEKQKLRAELPKIIAGFDALAKSPRVWKQNFGRQFANHFRAELAQAQPLTTVPIMEELPKSKHRVTKMQVRGNFMVTGETVTAGVPSAFHPLPPGMEANRLAMAKWLVSRQNPLTARVEVNRLWEQIFGIGLVQTSEEFGSQGERPSHPELLDWLAVDFMKDWNVKRFLKLVVMSATYRQSSRVTPELLAEDPDNRLLARGARYRLSAEAVRDQALAVSGLLSSKMYGPSVKPPQPSFGLSAAFGSSLDWKTSSGEDKYRRGIYTEWRRTNPYPSMMAFDATSRESCTIRRLRSNTPLQALVTLNDPVYVEAAQALARTMAATKGTPAEQLAVGFRSCLLRSPSAKETTRLLELYHDAKATYAKDPALAKAMATNPIGPLPKGADAADLAAWTVVGNVLLNLDEMFLKR